MDPRVNGQPIVRNINRLIRRVRAVQYARAVTRITLDAQRRVGRQLVTLKVREAAQARIREQERREAAATGLRLRLARQTATAQQLAAQASRQIAGEGGEAMRQIAGQLVGWLGVQQPAITLIEQRAALLGSLTKATGTDVLNDLKKKAARIAAISTPEE